MKHILCVGRALVDTVVASMDRLPARYAVRRAEEIHLAPGGAGATTAALLARLRHRVSILSRTGDDSPGDLLRGQLKSIGVNLEFLESDPARPTSMCLVAVGTGGRARYVYSDGADLCISRCLLDKAATQTWDLIHIGGFNLLVGDDGEPLRSWLFRLRRQNPLMVVTADASKALKYATRLSPLAQQVDYYFCNYTEGSQATKCASLEDIGTRAIEMGVRQGVIIKLDENGAYWVTKQAQGHVRGFVVRTVANENGAGDGGSPVRS